MHYGICANCLLFAGKNFVKNWWLRRPSCVHTVNNRGRLEIVCNCWKSYLSIYRLVLYGQSFDQNQWNFFFWHNNHSHGLRIKINMQPKSWQNMCTHNGYCTIMKKKNKQNVDILWLMRKNNPFPPTQWWSKSCCQRPCRIPQQWLIWAEKIVTKVRTLCFLSNNVMPHFLFQS